MIPSNYSRFQVEFSFLSREMKTGLYSLLPRHSRVSNLCRGVYLGAQGEAQGRGPCHSHFSKRGAGQGRAGQGRAQAAATEVGWKSGCHCRRRPPNKLRECLSASRETSCLVGRRAVRRVGPGRVRSRAQLTFRQSTSLWVGFYTALPKTTAALAV